MVSIDSAAEPGGSSRRVPRRLTFDSEPATIHDLLAQDAADSGPPGAGARRGAAGGIAPASEPPSRARRWASFMAPIAVVAAGLASLPAAPPEGAHRVAAAGGRVVPTSLPMAAPHAQVAQAAGMPAAQVSSGDSAPAAAAAVAQGGAVADVTSPKGAVPHAAAFPAVPASPAPPDAAPTPPGVLPARDALLDARSAPAAAQQVAPGAALRPERFAESAVQAVARGPGAASGRAGLREAMPAPGLGAQPARAGSARSASDLFEPAASRGGSQRSARLAAGGLTRVQAHQCGHLGALPRGFCEQRVQLTYCTGRYGRTGDCPLPTIAMPN